MSSAYVPPPLAGRAPLRRGGDDASTTRRGVRAARCTLASDGAARRPRAAPKTEDVFAADAGRDLFFNAMDEDTAISLLDAELGSLSERDDRFIAAERLKFFPSENSARAIMDFVHRFDVSALDSYTIEDRVSRRKAVESLARHKGQYLREEVVQLLMSCLADPDPYMAEVAIWGLAELDVRDENAMQAVTNVLSSGSSSAKRVAIHTLLRARFRPALSAVRPFVDDEDLPTASAARAACAVLQSDEDAMQPVLELLKSSQLNVRRSAIEDITLSAYAPALASICVCPNSLVLRARTVKVLLAQRLQPDESESEQRLFLDAHTARLLDRLIWDNPKQLDLLGKTKDTRRARAADRNIRQLYKNDALEAYLACRTLMEDFRGAANEEIGAAVLKSYNELEYFDYFGAYHVYKTLGWLKYVPAYALLLDNAANLPPRFFNHQAGAVTALAELGNTEAIDTIAKVAAKTEIWELKYACLIACERLGDGGKMREIFKDDEDWLIRARAVCDVDFKHLDL